MVNSGYKWDNLWCSALDHHDWLWLVVYSGLQYEIYQTIIFRYLMVYPESWVYKLTMDFQARVKLTIPLIYSFCTWEKLRPAEQAGVWMSSAEISLARPGRHVGRGFCLRRKKLWRSSENFGVKFGVSQQPAIINHPYVDALYQPFMVLMGDGIYWKHI